jgi:hypothetical protein
MEKNQFSTVNSLFCQSPSKLFTYTSLIWVDKNVSPTQNKSKLPIWPSYTFKYQTACAWAKLIFGESKLNLPQDLLFENLHEGIFLGSTFAAIIQQICYTSRK